jgi:ubiquinone/menaquinone biosynthesis C-methylase UbiE
MTTAEAYNRIAAVYDVSPNPLLALEQRILMPLFPALEGRLVADIGAGTGRWLRYAQASGAHTVALDVSAKMLASAPPSRVLANAKTIPLRDNSVDITLCTFALGYAPTCFPELARITRAGGTLIVTDLHPDALARGWSRTFRVGSEVLEPVHHRYDIVELHHPALTCTHLLEPHLGEPEREIFARAGKRAAFDAACAHPAIFVALWEKG